MPWNLAAAPRILCAERPASSSAFSKVRCVFRRDSGSLTFDVPPSETTRWRAVARVLRSPMDALGCALLPAFCALCGSPLPHLSYVPICAACWLEFPSQSGPACARCGDTLSRPALDSVGETLCRTCRLAPPPFVRAVAFGLYEGRMKEAIHALKYGRLRPAAHGLGRMLATAIGQIATEAPLEMLVIPVPLHRAKRAERGFNQARSLAEQALELSSQIPPRLAAHAGFECAHALARYSQPGRSNFPSATPERSWSIRGLQPERRRRGSTPADRRHSYSPAQRPAPQRKPFSAQGRLQCGWPPWPGRAAVARAEVLTRFFDDEKEVFNGNSNRLPENLQGVSIHSSHDQSSF